MLQSNKYETNKWR